MIDRHTLIKNFSIGFLPLLVFIVAEAWFGLTMGLIVAIVFGIGETGFVYFREKRIDRFILFDTGLIIILGAVSLLLQNDIFFKLKPGLIELIVVVLLAVTAFSDNPLLIRMSGRYMKGIEFSDQQIDQMRMMMRRLFYVFTCHTLLIFYAAFYMSSEAWAFISGGLFYIVIGIMLIVEFIRARWQRKRVIREFQQEEWFDIVNRDGRIIGKAPRSAVHGNPELLHPVVHVHIINNRGEVFLQKRSQNKDLYPGYWDTAIGGHVSSGESIDHALHREAEEELGISLAKFRPLFRYVMTNEYESELVHAYLLQEEGPFYINKNEIEEGKFWQLNQIEESIGKDVFTPNFEREFELLKKSAFSNHRKRGKR